MKILPPNLVSTEETGVHRSVNLASPHLSSQSINHVIPATTADLFRIEALVSRAYTILKHHGGATVHSSSGNLFGRDYFVSGDGNGIPPFNRMSEEDVFEFAWGRRKSLLSGTRSLGLWRDTDGRTYFDTCITSSSFAPIFKFANDKAEQYLYYLKTGELIPTDVGTPR